MQIQNIALIYLLLSFLTNITKQIVRLGRNYPHLILKRYLKVDASTFAKKVS